jgi:hypothetical protein
MECPEELSFIVYEKNGTTISTYFIIKKLGSKRTQAIQKQRNATVQFLKFVKCHEKSNFIVMKKSVQQFLPSLSENSIETV